MSITAIYTSISLTAFKYLPMYYLPKKKSEILFFMLLVAGLAIMLAHVKSSINTDKATGSAWQRTSRSDVSLLEK